MLIAETARIRIRPWRPDEADRLFDLLRRREVARWLGVERDVMRDRSVTVERIVAWSTYAEKHPGFGSSRPGEAHRGGAAEAPTPAGR